MVPAFCRKLAVEGFRFLRRPQPVRNRRSSLQRDDVRSGADENGEADQHDGEKQFSHDDAPCPMHAMNGALIRSSVTEPANGPSVVSAVNGDDDGTGRADPK